MAMVGKVTCFPLPRLLVPLPLRPPHQRRLLRQRNLCWEPPFIPTPRSSLPILCLPCQSPIPLLPSLRFHALVPVKDGGLQRGKA
ncbi:hypothetical protein KSP39_PZI015989 [Platanthera zijinensis]|uniref:Uncharacterized protein n=1 Tax=Platanthera zijinensis TaxID=2320716 RepID=A0AAP0B8T9_9ASPA